MGRVRTAILSPDACRAEAPPLSRSASSRNALPMLENIVETKSLGHNVDLAERAYRVRRNALLMGEVQGQGYIGQALDIADVLAVAYFHAMRYRPEDPHWEERDRFLLSN